LLATTHQNQDNSFCGSSLRILETPPKKVLLNPPVSTIKWGKEQDGVLASHSQELGIPLVIEALLTMYKEHPAHAQ
jgi:hypothetical protein